MFLYGAAVSMSGCSSDGSDDLAVAIGVLSFGG